TQVKTVRIWRHDGQRRESMLSGVWRCAAGASPRGTHRHRFNFLTALLFGLTASGCSSVGTQTGSIGPFAASRTATIAIESIDGPPLTLTRKLTTTLGEEAEARQLAIVPREEPAQYRVRGY